MKRPRPRLPRLAAIAWIIAIARVMTTAAGAQPPASELAVRPPEIVLEAPPELAAAAARVRRLDPQRLVGVMRLLGLTDPGPPVRVVLAGEGAEIARRTSPWVAGFAEGGSGLIVLFPARTLTYPYDSIEDLLPHEVAHVLISRAAPGAQVPRWFHEGVAMAAERTWGLEDRTRLAVAVVAGHRSLGDLDADFAGGPSRATRAYGIAGAFVRDLIRRYGPDLPARIIARLARGERFDRAFAAAAGAPLSEAERLFWQRSFWYQAVPFLTSSLVMWLGIVFLAVYARRRRAQHRAALRRKWEEEEE